MKFIEGRALVGSVIAPGDKSISHRALMLAALADGQSHIIGLSEGKDVLSTVAALQAMGVKIRHTSDGIWKVDGAGIDGLTQPKEPIDMGNSGTSTRLLMGLIASRRIKATFIGDASLSRRPMDRVIAPLRKMGAQITASPGDTLPLHIQGAYPAKPGTFRLNITSAQVKSALLLAGLNTPGITRIIEPIPTRNHSEQMLKLFGANLRIDRGEITLHGQTRLKPQRIEIPGDPSSAAFLAVAALIVPGSEVQLEGVCINPMRIGLYEILRQMGGYIKYTNERIMDGEPVADIIVRHSLLRGVEVPRKLVPAMIDEFPIFFIAAAFASGKIWANGLAELRVKESDRITTMVTGLRAIGAQIEENNDGVIIHGSSGGALKGGVEICSQLDHRVAMSFAVAGLVCNEPVTIDDMTSVQTSFPGFTSMLCALQNP